MDYEKLIEQLKQKDGLWCSVPTGEKLVTDAADALTALLAENERLKNKLSELAHLPFDNPGVGERTRLMAENAQLRDELEQAKTEITRLKHYEDKCHDCPIVCAKTEIIKAHEELEAVQAELEQVKRELQAYKDTGLEPEDFKRAFHEDAVLKLAGQALGIAPDRLRELAQAHKENRVLPEGSGWFVTCSGKKLTVVMDIEAALRREQDG
mgnify:CR=1 FL=1|jgi:cell division septum initiation protein DivIVA